MIIDMQIQGVTAPSASAVVYSSPTTPQTNAIFYVENVRFGTNYTHAKVVGTSGGNCIMQCSNVKYGGYPFTLGFYVTNDGSGIGRMQLRNVTSTNGGVSTTTGLIFAKADQPGCAFIVNGCLLTKAVGAAAGTGFWVENGGSLRLTAVNFQRWITGIYAPNTGTAPSIFGSALNFENNTTDVLVEHPTATGKIEGTDSFLKTMIPVDAPLYEVNQDPRRITVAKKGGDFTSVSASVAYISGSSETNRFVIDIGPGQFIEKQIDLSNKPYVSMVGSTIQTTQIVASGSGNYDQILLGPTNEISFLSIYGVNNPGYAAIKVDGTGDNFAQAHKVSIYDFDYGIKVFSSVSRSTFYGEYIDINGAFSYGTYVSASNTTASLASMENYYLFPSGGVSIGNYASGLGAELDLYTCLFVGDNVSGSTSVYLADGAIVEVAGFDAQYWEYGVRVPNIGNPPTFRMVGAMIHNSITSDFLVEQPATRGRFQGISDHTKINNASPDFYWNFLDDTDGENDVTRKLSVTFEDGTHTDATTLIFNGSAMGVLNRGEISVVTGLTASVSGGFGYVKIPSTEIYKRLDWPDTQIILPSSSNNYLYFNDNQNLLYGGTSPDYLTNIILGRVVTNQTGIAFIDQSPYLAYHTSNLLSTFNKQALGPVYADGSIVTANAAVSYSLDTTAGNYFYSENQFMPTGGTGITFTRYYVSGSGFNTTNTTTVPSNVYNSGSLLIPMSASYFTKHSLYVVGQGTDEKYMLVVGQNQFATLIETEGANLPLPPTFFSDSVVSIASIYVQSGSSNVIQIEDIRPVIGFKASGINASSVHGNLLGLSADDHTQYLLVDGARQMAANLGLGGNDIYNVDLITATSVSSSFTGSLLGTASYATQALSASFAPSTPAFPFTGSALITGSLGVTGSISIIGGLTGSALVAQNLTGSEIFRLQNDRDVVIGGGSASTDAQVTINPFRAPATTNYVLQVNAGANNFMQFLNSPGSTTGGLRISRDSIALGRRALLIGSGTSDAFWITSNGSIGINPNAAAGINTAEVGQGIINSSDAGSSGLYFVSQGSQKGFIFQHLGQGSNNTTQAVFQIRKTFTETSGISYTERLFNLNGTYDLPNGSKNLIGIDYDMTITALSGAHYGLLIRPSGTLNGIGLGSTLPTATWHIKGNSDSVGTIFRAENLSNNAFLNLNSLGTLELRANNAQTTNVSLFNIYNGSELSLQYVAGLGYQPYFNFISSTVIAGSTSAIVGYGNAGGTPVFQINAPSNRIQYTAGEHRFIKDYTSTYVIFANPTSGITITGTITPSGTGVTDFGYAGVLISPTINQTSTSGYHAAIDYRPTLTSITGSHFGFLIRPSGTLSGIGLGNTFPSASLHVRGLTGSVLLLENNVSSSILVINNNGTGSYNGFLTTTGSLLGTASFATQALSSSFATTASFVLSASFAPTNTTGSFTGSFTGSLLGTASYANQALSSSFASTASITISASYAATASYVVNALTASYIVTAQTASYVLNAVSSSFASTASIATSSSYALSASFAPTNTTGSFTGSFTGSLLGTASFSSNTFTNLKTTRFEMGVSSTSAITTGAKGRKTVGYNGTIVGWSLVTDQNTTITLDIWKANNAIPTVANSITGSAPISLTSAQLGSSTTLTGWNTSVSNNDVFIVSVNSNNNATYFSLDLDIVLTNA